MIGYATRRFLELIPTLFIITFLLFFGMQLVPGGPEAAFAFNSHMSEAAKQAIIHRWGLDQPVYIQYFKWLTSMASGDWQTSFFLNRPVKEVILQKLPATLILMTTAYILQEIIALPAGLLAALRRYSLFDQAVTFFSYVGYSMPTFWLGLMLLLIFAVQIPIFPVAGIIDIRTTGAPFLTSDYNVWFAQHRVDGLLDIGRHVVLPALTIAIVGIAGDSRFMRSSMLDAIHQDFVRTARAKGLGERAVILKHALRNALLPVITNIALTLPGLFSGAVVTEAIFSWPGMGQLFFQALSQFDYPLLMGILFVSAILVVSFNFLADVAYAIVDPRISYA
ncbi:MAG TPA: ABC transporter permease [Candidatus Dormibacteraeota bacterium]|nr:ABC transporter permease [Candidatus Dormibacteraeota bacterium]